MVALPFIDEGGVDGRRTLVAAAANLVAVPLAGMAHAGGADSPNRLSGDRRRGRFRVAPSNTPGFARPVATQFDSILALRGPFNARCQELSL
jgi:hypothetical protein